MRITAVQQLHADGGWRPFSFLKISTDEGLVGWSEFNLASWNTGLSETITGISRALIGRSPTPVGPMMHQLRTQTRMAPGGMNAQAVAAIENACLDLWAKQLGVPVYDLLGGPYRTSIDAYWSHCGSFRAREADLFEKVVGVPAVRTYEDLVRVGREVRERGFAAAKTNLLLPSDDGLVLVGPGFAPGGVPSRPVTRPVLAALDKQLEHLREGTGPDVDLMLDLNFSFNADGVRRILPVAERHGLAWLEVDFDDPQTCAVLRGSTSVPLASLETLHGHPAYLSALAAQVVDVAIVDVIWNGLGQAVRIAETAAARGIRAIPHNFYGPLATVISAHFCASSPLADLIEVEADDVPWKDELLVHPSPLHQGRVQLCDRPGWGWDVDEAAVNEHPARP